MISASERALSLAVLLALAVSSVAFGAEVPPSFFGTYQGVLERACMTSLIVLGKENIRWDRGDERKNVPYTVVEADDQHVILELHSSECRLSFLRLDGSKPDDANALQDGLRVSGFRTRSEALADTSGLDCHYRRVDPELAEDQTARFLHSESAAEREKALDIINQQFHPESDKYNEIGLRDFSPAVRARAASFLRGDPDRSVPLLIKAMAHDPDPKVRANAGESLSSLYGGIDRGPEGDSGPEGESDADDESDAGNESAKGNEPAADPRIALLEQNLGDLLIGLKTLTTLRSVVEILGGGDYDDALVCHMSAKSREKTLSALNDQLEAIQVLKEESGHDRWSKVGQRISRAMERKCNTVQSNRPRDSASSPDDLQEDQASSKGDRKETCEFAGLVLPENYAIFAAGEYSGRKIDFQIDQSGDQATQMDVTVNYSSKPVVLILAAHKPTIWNIKWTANTRIAAVLVSGFHRQIVVGLDATVPILNSSYHNQGPCGELYIGENKKDLTKVNKTSRRLFGRPVDLVYLAENGQIVVGDAIPESSTLVSSGSITPESFHDRTVPLAGLPGLEDAVTKGILRKATETDFEAWVDAEIAYEPDRDVPLIAGRQGRPRPIGPVRLDGYVVLRQFTYPAGLDDATIFIPEGVPQPKGAPGPHVYDFNKLKADRKASEKLRDDEKRLSEGQTKDGCQFAGLALPENFAVFAAGNYSGRKIHFQIDQSGHQATQMDVKVNYPSKPVVLILGAYEPTVWNIKWTANTRIAAVFVSGYRRQAIAGLDAAVPVLNSTLENRGPCGYFKVGESERDLTEVNKTSRRLFGRPVDLVYLAKNGKAVVGDPVPAGEKLITSESNPPESFYDKTAPRTGRAGLKDAVQKGFLRKATEADVEAWVNAEIANRPDRDVPPIAGQRPAMPKRPSIDNAYVVLKPFTFPAGLYSNPAIFFIPKGVPLPKRNPGYPYVYDFNKFKIEPPPPAPQTQESNAGHIRAASFDCSKATSDVEKTICANDELSRLDDSLMKAYQRVLDRTRKKEEMIQSQNQWLENERNECQDAKCIKKAYEMRINELRLSSYSLVFFRPPVRSTPYSEVNTKLLKAAKKGSLEEAKTLLEKGADVNAKDQEDHLTVLMFAALSSNLELVKHLVNRGADVNARDKDGKTAFMFASRLGNVDVMRLLMDHGTDVNIRDKDGKTALMAAAAKGDLEAVRFLLDSGADVHAEAANGNTALQLAEEEDNEEIIRLLKSRGAEE